MTNLPFQFTEDRLDVSRRDKVLRRIDGLATSPMATSSTENVVDSSSSSNKPMELFEEDQNSVVSSSGVDYQNFDTEIPAKMPTRVKKVKTVVIKSTAEEKKTNEETRSMGTWFSFLWGGPTDRSHSREEAHHIVEQYVENIFPMACGSHHDPLQRNVSNVPSSLVRVASGENADGYAEVVNAQELFIDPRMPDWIDCQCMERDPLPKGGTYQLGESRSIIVHELIRGSWTWCTAWSPDGRRLAIGTENHHLAVVDTFSSSVWRIKHDKRVTGPSKGNDMTHSIRSIAWGSHFIATGGVGGSVSILSTNEPYPILHRITPTGFVGSLDWLKDTTTLVIGSRNGKATILKIIEEDDDISSQVIDQERKIQSMELHTIDRDDAWVNAVKFSPGGKAVAVGDSKGILGVYGYKEQPGAPVSVSNIANFKLEDSILDVEWSPDGQWLYAGGEDFCVTVINTPSWEAIHRIKRDRWVQFISASHGCSHVAIGGVSSEVSIMDVDRGWDTALNVSLKGLVPLSAKWHPQDQYLVLTGQNNSVLAIETTNSRYVPGHFLRSASPILAIRFSPDGRMAAIGNEAGIVTIFKLSGTSFITMYELVLDGDGSLSIEWSKKGTFLVVVAGSKVVVITKSNRAGNSPPNTSGFHISQVIRLAEQVHDVALSPNSRYVAVSGLKKTHFLDATANFKSIREIGNEVTTLANSWSPDGCWFATIGRNQNLLIYDTSSPQPSEWKIIFTVQTPQSDLTLAWGPPMVGGLQYLAYGGEGLKVYIMEIRTKERAWETVLAIPREGVIYGLDWNNEGLLAAAVGNGTISIMDLSYLQSGWAVNEMDYNWQRQALTCFTEIRRNKGKNSMRSVRWIPSAPGSHSLLACGGTDGEVEIIDLTDRRRCSGFKAPVTVS
jgi:WD40 repeat protein